jgi:hypothetical protein
VASANIATLVTEVRHLRDQLRRAGRTQNLVIGSLLDEKLELRSPLPVLLEYDGAQFIASSADLNVYGAGKTELDALDDFRQAVADFYFSLKGEKLGTDLKRRFAYLRSVIREK